MNQKLKVALASLVLTSSVQAGEGLYSVGDQPEDLIPLQWMVGLKVIHDDNATPGGDLDGEEASSIMPYIGGQLTNMTPRTVVDVYAEIGMMYYFDKPQGLDDTSINSRMSLDVFHDVNERISLATRNFISYELEPNYAYGYASSRQGEEHLFWSTDNSIDYNWTDRLATRTGVKYFGTHYEDSEDSNRQSISLSNQFRYLLSPQTIGTVTYRHTLSKGEGNSSDSNDQYITFGAEHRFSPNHIGSGQIGVQLRDVDDGDSSSNPFFNLTLISQMNSQFMIRNFLRYSVEDTDTVQNQGGNIGEYDERATLRFGSSASYDLSPKLQLFGGVDYIRTSLGAGRLISGSGTFPDADEEVINAYIGFALKITETIEANCSYNFTDSDSPLSGRDYDRNRFSLGVSAIF